MSNEEILELDFYDLCGIDAIGMSDNAKLIAYYTKIEKHPFIRYNGYYYLYEYRLAKHGKDICLATKDPNKYCNGIFLYSDKDAGNGKEFVVVLTDDPNINI